MAAIRDALKRSTPPEALIRLLAVPNPVSVLGMMAEDGVLAAVLPEATQLDRLERLIAPEAPALPLRGSLPPHAGEGRGGGAADPLRRLAALVDVDAAGMAAIAERLRLSNPERDRLIGLAAPWPLDPTDDERAQRRALYRLGAERYRDLALLTAAEGGMDKPRLAELLALATQWQPPRFPLAGRDVLALGIPPGVRVGELLAEVRQWWEEGDFSADRAACLDLLADIAQN